jgi:hypothetical protein
MVSESLVLNNLLLMATTDSQLQMLLTEVAANLPIQTKERVCGGKPVLGETIRFPLSRSETEQTVVDKDLLEFKFLLVILFVEQLKTIPKMDNGTK